MAISKYEVEICTPPPNFWQCRCQLPTFHPYSNLSLIITYLPLAIKTLLICLQFRNQYDSDVTTWSPDGRLHQVEYAMEAVKQGSATVGLKSKTHAVLVNIISGLR
jgi:hypothetical protein